MSVMFPAQKTALVFFSKLAVVAISTFNTSMFDSLRMIWSIALLSFSTVEGHTSNLPVILLIASAVSGVGGPTKAGALRDVPSGPCDCRSSKVLVVSISHIKSGGAACCSIGR